MTKKKSEHFEPKIPFSIRFAYANGPIDYSGVQEMLELCAHIPESPQFAHGGIYLTAVTYGYKWHGMEPSWVTLSAVFRPSISVRSDREVASGLAFLATELAARFTGQKLKTRKEGQVLSGSAVITFKHTERRLKFKPVDLSPFIGTIEPPTTK